MKAITTLIIVLFAASFTFASNGNPVKSTPIKKAATVVAVKDKDANTQMSAAMDAVLGSLITNNTATVSTTMDDAAMMTLTSDDKIIITDSFSMHIFNETLTSEEIVPAPPVMEIITLEVEEL